MLTFNVTHTDQLEKLIAVRRSEVQLGTIKVDRVTLTQKSVFISNGNTEWSREELLQIVERMQEQDWIRENT